eukprot:3795453-Rhodomonas_salina.1
MRCKRRRRRRRSVTRKEERDEELRRGAGQRTPVTCRGSAWHVTLRAPEAPCGLGFGAGSGVRAQGSGLMGEGGVTCLSHSPDWHLRWSFKVDRRRWQLVTVTATRKRSERCVRAAVEIAAQQVQVQVQVGVCGSRAPQTRDAMLSPTLSRLTSLHSSFPRRDVLVTTYMPV